MKKKLFALFCAAAVFSATACGGGASSEQPANQTEAATEAVKLDPKEVYAEAVAKNAELDDMDLTMDTDMAMTMGEETMNMSMTMEIKTMDSKSDDIKCLFTTTTEAEGESFDMTMFYTDGYYYMDVMDQKIKYAMDAETIKTQTDASSAGMEVDMDWMSELTLEEQGSDKVIKFVGDPAKMEGFMEELLASSGAANTEGVETSLKSVSGECVIGGDGYYKSEKLVMDIEMSMEDQIVSMTMDMTMTYNNPGQEVSFELPSTDGYTEVDAGMFQQ